MRPAVVHGSIAENYYVDPEGNIWSTKRITPKMLSWTTGGGGYPTVTISQGGVSRTCYVHKIVCETFHKFPIPFGVTKKEWRETPDSVKVHVYKTFEVNHIDHGHDNFHPDNLEWVSRMENLSKYQDHRKENHGQRKTRKSNKSPSVVAAFAGLETFFLEE